jgi:Domain of unknown function (DUF4442)
MVTFMSLKLKYSALLMKYGINFWGPFFGAGIKVISANKDFNRIEVALKETWFNRNIVGVHFGGSLYAMCDPFFMAILLHHLGRDFTVWDKAATIKFKRPGKGTVTAVFEIPLSTIQDIKDHAKNAPKLEPIFNVQVKNSEGEVVADVEKTLYVKYKLQPNIKAQS